MSIVLDTNIVRALGAGDLPRELIDRAVRAGISIHLSETAGAELIHQLVTGQLSWAHWTHARSIVTEVVDSDEPVLLGAGPGLVRTGLAPSRGPSSAFMVSDSIDRHQAAWRLLVGADTRDDLTAMPVGSADPRYVFGLDEAQVRAAMRAEKEDWIQDFTELEKLLLEADPDLPSKLSRPGAFQEAFRLFFQIVADGIDEQCPDCDPPASFRLDAFLRVHALLRLRRLRPKDPYNPVKDANDALDQSLLRYLAQPAAVCTQDSGIFSDVKAAESWQLKWIVRPEDLKDEYIIEELQTMRWPTRPPRA